MMSNLIILRFAYYFIGAIKFNKAYLINNLKGWELRGGLNPILSNLLLFVYIIIILILNIRDIVSVRNIISVRYILSLII